MPEPTSPGDAGGIWTTMVDRHAAYAAEHPTVDGPPEHRPLVAILACSDARVPPSLLFGQEPGVSFVVRLAGNSATAGAIASLTYATEQLGVELVVVLGHTGCGAVTAALEGATEASLNPILTPIDEMLAACDTCGDVDGAVAANVRHNVGRLHRDRGPLGEAVRSGRVTVRAAVHDLATGRLVDLDAVPAAPGIMDTSSASDIETPNLHPPTMSTSSPRVRRAS